MTSYCLGNNHISCFTNQISDKAMPASAQKGAQKGASRLLTVQRSAGTFSKNLSYSKAVV